MSRVFERASTALEVPVSLELAKLSVVRECKLLDADQRETVLAELERDFLEPALLAQCPKVQPQSLAGVLALSALAKSRFRAMVKQVAVVLVSGTAEKPQDRLSFNAALGTLTWTVPFGLWKEKGSARGFGDRVDDAVPLLMRVDTVFIPRVEQQLATLASALPGIDLAVKSWDFVNDKKFGYLKDDARQACVNRVRKKHSSFNWFSFSFFC